MYHELALPSRDLCHQEPGYTRYVVAASDFRIQMERLAGQGWRGRNVSDALQSFDHKTACITFDDGCETDLISATPVLQELGFGATFYLTLGYLDKPGYLSHMQVRNLRALGFEVGCHSLSHSYLTDIDDARLRDETAGAKDRLEQIGGTPVEHFSCPGGRWDTRVMKAVRAAGFRTMATSRSGLNFPGTNHFALRRIAILAGTNPDALLRICSGKGLVRTQLKEKLGNTAKSLLGNSNYDRLRGFVLTRPKS